MSKIKLFKSTKWKKLKKKNTFRVFGLDFSCQPSIERLQLENFKAQTNITNGEQQMCVYLH